VPFELLGVIDARQGRAVRAQGGQRDRYAPVESIAGDAIPPGDAVALARAYINGLGLNALYVADLDAIVHRAPQDGLVRDIAALGAPLWLDAGVTSVEDAHRAIDAGATQVVVGLETLTSFDVLDEICTAIGGSRITFSLDLRAGRPIGLSEVIGQRSVTDLVLRAAWAGVGSLIVLDVARVGTGVGFDLDLIADVLRAAPTLTLLAGGGVRGWDDLVTLAEAGCDGALVATSLQSGALTASHVAAARHFPSTENASNTLPGMNPREL
jgi:phosphoribosylformimino-5-aminoimidazole carboxamide ribotide isomerase